MRKIRLLFVFGIMIVMYGYGARDHALKKFAESLQVLMRSAGSLGDEDDEDRGDRPARGDRGRRPTKHVSPADEFELPDDFDKPVDQSVKTEPDKPEKDKPEKDKPVVIQPDKPVKEKPVIPIKIEPEPEPFCADIQAVSYLKDLDIKIQDGDSVPAQTIPLAADKNPLTFGSICSKKGSATEKKYTITFDGQAIAELTCLLGPSNDQYMQVSILKEEKSTTKIQPITSVQFKTPDSTSNVLAEIKLPGVTPKAGVVSRVRVMVDMVRGKTNNSFKIAVDAVPTCTSKALIEATNQRTDLKKVQIKLDQTAQQIDIPAGKAYVSLGHVCQEEDGISTRTCVLLVNGKEIAHVDLKFGPKSSETREATIKIFSQKGKDPLTVTGKSDEQVSAVAVVDEGVRVRITVLPVKEGILPVQSKFKIYIQESAACTTRARVEVVDQRPDLKNVEIVDAYGRRVATNKTSWILADEICREPSTQVSETYRIVVNKKEAALITCIFGPESDEFLQTVITAGADARPSETVTSEKFSQPVAAKSTFLDVFVSGVGRLKITAELVKEGQSKFKIYLQEILSCGAKALVEVINQRKDLGKIELKDDYDQIFDIPDISQKAYVPIGGICQLPSKIAQDVYTLLIASKPVAKITCLFGPSDGELMRVVLTRLSGSLGPIEEVTSVDYKGIGTEFVRMPLIIPGLGRGLLGVELIKEGGQNKFKFYLQDPAACGAQALVEVQNQVAGLSMTVEDMYAVKTDIPDWTKLAYVALAPICQEKEVDAQERYTIKIAGQKVAEVSCMFGPSTNDHIQASIKAFDDKGLQISEVEGLNYENVSAILGPVNGGNRYEFRVITEKLGGQSKFKWYLQPLEACGPQAAVEVQNQTALSVKIKNTYGKEAEILNWSKVGYINFDTICQKKSEVAEEEYTIFVAGKPAARVRCKLGPASNETRISDIMSVKDEILVSGGWGIKYDFDTFRLTVESIVEGMSKFKIYIQKKGG